MKIKDEIQKGNKKGKGRKGTKRWKGGIIKQWK